MAINITDLRNLLAKTTQGEWRYVTRKEQSESGCYYNAGRVVSSGVDVADAVNANAEFIAIAHNIMPQLLDRLELLERDNAVALAENARLKIELSAEKDLRREATKETARLIIAHKARGVGHLLAAFRREGVEGINGVLESERDAALQENARFQAENAALREVVDVARETLEFNVMLSPLGIATIPESLVEIRDALENLDAKEAEHAR